MNKEKMFFSVCGFIFALAISVLLLFFLDRCHSRYMNLETVKVEHGVMYEAK